MVFKAVKVLGVIPARYASSRLPGKPLAEIAGKPMIRWVYERALKAQCLSDCMVATDDKQVFQSVEEFGGKVIMTSSDCRTGTDRVAEVAQKSDAEIIVNIQGDEPMIEPNAIDDAVQPFIEDHTLLMGTLVRQITSLDELTNPNTVRVVIDKKGFALYFSRAIIPYCRDIKDKKKWIPAFHYYRHIGLYVYRKNFLLSFTKMETTPLEKIEQLEQLRALENGIKIKTVITDYNPVCVDTPEDLKKVQSFFIKRRFGGK